MELSVVSPPVVVTGGFFMLFTRIIRKKTQSKIVKNTV